MENITVSYVKARSGDRLSENDRIIEEAIYSAKNSYKLDTIRNHLILLALKITKISCSHIVWSGDSA